jgi:hypothetical protein
MCLRLNYLPACQQGSQLISLLVPQMYTSSLPLYCQLVVDSEDDGEGEQDSGG